MSELDKNSLLSQRKSNDLFFKRLSIPSDPYNFYFEIPWSPQIYFTVRGAENLHIILWYKFTFLRNLKS